MANDKDESVQRVHMLIKKARDADKADEEGHMKRLPFNHEATKAWRECLDATGIPYRLDMAVLVGDVAIVYRKVK